jgi:hypothetical protein
MFSQTRGLTSSSSVNEWRGDCVLDSQLAQLSRERHNLITSHSSWFALHAVYWNNNIPASSSSASPTFASSAPSRGDSSSSSSSSSSSGSDSGHHRGALEFEAVAFAGGRRGGNGGGAGAGARALRRVAMQRDPRLSLFGGNRSLSSLLFNPAHHRDDQTDPDRVPMFPHQVGKCVMPS